MKETLTGCNKINNFSFTFSWRARTMEPSPLLFEVRSWCFNPWPPYPFRKLDIRRQLSLVIALLWISPPLPSSCLAGVGGYFLLIPSPARETLRKLFAYLICVSCNLRGQVDWHVINLKTEWLYSELAWQKLNLKSSMFEKYSPRHQLKVKSVCFPVSKCKGQGWPGVLDPTQEGCLAERETEGV